MDAHTLAVCNLLFLFLYAATIFVYRTMYRLVQPGLRGCDLFIASNLILALPFLYLLVPIFGTSRGQTFFGWLLALMGHLPLHRAFAEMLDRKRKLWRTQLGVAVVGLAILLAGYLIPAFASVHEILSLIYGVQYALTGIMIFQVATGEGRAAAWFAGAVSAIFATCHFIWYVLSLPWSVWDGGRTTPAIRLAAHGGLALAFLLIAISRLQIQMRRETELDELTGLMNLRAIRRLAAEEIVRCRGKKTSLCVLMIDLDGFKDANDRYGHDAGDALLRAVARALVWSLRAEDKVARLGGDEFCMLIPDVEVWQAVHIAERCRETLSEIIVPYDGKRLQISACLGVSYSADCAMSWEELLHRGDVAMYQAKREGGNRVALADWPREPLPSHLEELEGRTSEWLR